MKNFCKKYNLTQNQFLGLQAVGGSLDLGSLTAIPEGFNPTVGGSLYLRSLTAIPEGFNPTVGGSLDLRSLTAIPEGFNPTVGGSLYLGSLTAIPEGFNPTVGGSLYLGILTAIPEGFNPTVGGSLDLGNLTANVPVKPYGNPILSWGNGKFILCDGMFTEVLSKKKGCYFVKKINSKREFYIATDGVYTHAHGQTLKQAREDLQFKIISEKLKSEPIEENTLLTVKHYRLITGACDTGVRDFMRTNGIPFKIENGETKEVKPIKAKDLLPILIKNNAYGVEKFKKLITF